MRQFKALIKKAEGNNVVTVTTAYPHGFKVGDKVTIDALPLTAKKVMPLWQKITLAAFVFVFGCVSGGIATVILQLYTHGCKVIC